MRIAVAGGTGVVGSLVVAAAGAAGHETVVLSRAHGVDLASGSGVRAALDGADVVIDAANSAGSGKRTSVAFFTAATTTLLTAERDAGVGHHVALSIVGIDRVPLGYYEGKRRQEALVAEGGVPWTVLRATQFHEFPGQLLARQRGPVAAMPRMLSATVAASEVAARLVELATGDAIGPAPEFGGPGEDLVHVLARRTLRARGARRVVVPLPVPGALGRALAGGGLLPRGDGPRGVQTFDAWLGGGPA